MASDDALAFGRRLLGTQDAVAIGALEDEHRPSLSPSLRALHRELGDLVGAAIRGEEIVQIPGRDERPTSVNVSQAAGLLARHADLLDRERQRERGLWTHPDSTNIAVGLVNGGYWLSHHPRFAQTHAWAQGANLAFETATATLLWGLEPLFRALWQPLMQAGTPRSGIFADTRSPAAKARAWDDACETYTALGIDPVALQPFEPSSDHGPRSLDDLTALRLDLFASWQPAADTASERFRYLQIRRLVEQYYARAKNGRVLRTKVLTKDHSRTLALYFAGDWRALLEYLGEEAHPRDELPDARPAQPGPAAAATSTSVEAEPRLPAAVEDRIALLRDYWQVTGELHERQKLTEPSSWHAVQIGLGASRWPFVRDLDTERALCARVLPVDLRSRIDELFGQQTLERCPTALVTATDPLRPINSILGSASRTWDEGLALTAWWTRCPDGYSRTSIGGIPEYCAQPLAELAAAETPIDPSVFPELLAVEVRADLRAVERRIEGLVKLAPEGRWDPPTTDLQTVRTHLERSEAVRAQSLLRTVSLRLPHGFYLGDDEFLTGISDDEQPRDELAERASTYLQLRDTVAQHRQVWTATHLERWLRHRFDEDIGRVQAEYDRVHGIRGKSPTPGQMTKIATSAANTWFGGQLAGVYDHLRLDHGYAEAASRSRLMPDRIDDLCSTVFIALGGTPDYAHHFATSADETTHARDEALRAVTLLTPVIVQLLEGLDREPKVQDVGRSAFDSRIQRLRDAGATLGTEDPWSYLVAVIRQSLSTAGSVL